MATFRVQRVVGSVGTTETASSLATNTVSIASCARYSQHQLVSLVYRLSPIVQTGRLARLLRHRLSGLPKVVTSWHTGRYVEGGPYGYLG